MAWTSLDTFNDAPSISYSDRDEDYLPTLSNLVETYYEFFALRVAGKEREGPASSVEPCNADNILT